jgi:ribosomal protein L37AE/L43A
MISIKYINDNYKCPTCNSSDFHGHSFEPIVYCKRCKDSFLIEELEQMEKI